MAAGKKMSYCTHSLANASDMRELFACFAVNHRQNLHIDSCFVPYSKRSYVVDSAQTVLSDTPLQLLEIDKREILMKKMILTIISSIVAWSMMSTTAHATCGEVSITEMDWASGAIITTVSKFIMERGYQCDVTVVPSSTVPSVASVAETGKPDIVTELWQNSAPVYEKLKNEGKITTVAAVFSDGGVEGWWIPQYLAEQHPELTTIDGILANPDKVGGLFHNCPEGWGCRIANDNLIQAYDFAGKGMEVFNHGGSETLAASIASAYADEKPWFGYYWEPTAILGKYPMVKVDVGPYVKEHHDCNQTPDCANPKKSAYPAASVITGVTTDFAQREPEIFDLMSKVSFTNAIMNEVLAWKERKTASNGEAAAYYLSRYKHVWKEWLNEDAAQRLAPILR